MWATEVQKAIKLNTEENESLEDVQRDKLTSNSSLASYSYGFRTAESQFFSRKILNTKHLTRKMNREPILSDVMFFFKINSASDIGGHEGSLAL